MMVFVFANMIALAVRFAKAERELAVATGKSEKLAMRNVALDSLNRMKTEYLTNISHEMKTPLTVASVGVQVANELIGEAPGEDAAAARDQLKNAQSEIMRLSRIVAGNLELASMRESRQHMEKLNLRSLLAASAESYRLMVENAGNRLETDLAEDLVPVFGGADLLAQVATNLLQNANRHTRGGLITIMAKNEGAMARVTVRDTGGGIAPEFLPHVFERGVSDGGTGYGLYLCKTIIEAHGGAISIKSELGKGTSVTFTLPRYEGQIPIKTEEEPDE
jgi:signal transduction histidine kinase